jgi:hypothetical protein
MSFYLQTYSGTTPKHVTLEPGIDAAVIAGGCRRAGLEFVRGVHTGWDARDLAAWLTGPYAQATCHVPRGECVARIDDEESPTSFENAPRLQEVLASARTGAISALEDAESIRGRLVFVREAIRDRTIVPATSANGESIWVPLDRRKMNLRDRVLSLFAVDFLLRPEDYVGDLLVCSSCEAVVFDAKARALGHCGAHRASGFMPRHEEPFERIGFEPIEPPRPFFEDYESDRAIPLTRVR